MSKSLIGIRKPNSNGFAKNQSRNFLLLQAAYAEIYFTPVLWPDFDEKQFKLALTDYAARERRYGQTAEQLQGCQA